MQPMRICAVVGALLGWFALLLQLYLMLVQSPGGARAMVGTVITYFSFFTILTNLLVALVFTAVFSAARSWMAGVFLPSVGTGRCRGLHRDRGNHLPPVAAAIMESAGHAVGRRRHSA